MMLIIRLTLTQNVSACVTWTRQQSYQNQLEMSDINFLSILSRTIHFRLIAAALPPKCGKRLRTPQAIPAYLFDTQTLQ